MEDFDIKEFAKMFDAALASDNPTVKKALRNFMIVAAIVTAEETDPRPAGPFAELINEIQRLSAKISSLESQMYGSTRSYPTYPYDTNKYTGINPTWVYSPTTSAVSTTSAVNTKSWAEVDNTINDLLRDLKFNNE